MKDSVKDKLEDTQMKFKLSEVADIISGGTPSTETEEFWNGNIEWFTPSEVGKNKYIHNSKRKITQIGLQKSSAKLIPSKSILMSTRATIGELAINKEECTTNQGFQNLVPKKGIVDLEYLYYRMQTMKNKMILLSSGSTFLELSATEVKNLKISIHDYEKQVKYGKLLSSMDQLINLQTDMLIAIDDLFYFFMTSFFRNHMDSTISHKSFDKLFKKLKSNKNSIDRKLYNAEGKYPIVSQEKNLINGYSDASDLLISENVYIFGDHTLILKKVDFPFIKGADGTVLLTGNNLDFNYGFYLLKSKIPKSEGYKRHFSILSETDFKVHENKKTQEKIGALLNSIDELKNLYSQNIAELNNLKKYNLNKIFS